MKHVKLSNWKGGEDRWSGPVDLPPDSALICRNQQYRQSGVLEPRRGSERYDVEADDEIMGIRECEFHGDKYYIVIDKSGRIRLFNPSTPSLSTLADGLSTLSRSYWSFAQVNESYLLITNGIDRPRIFDGEEVRECGSIKFPIFSGVGELSSSDTQEVGYAVKVTFYDEENDYESALSNSTNLVMAQRDTPTLTLNLSSQSVAAPARFSHYKIYRTRGNGMNYYYEKKVAIDAVSAVLDANDNELMELAPSNNSPAPSMPYAASGLGFLWLAGNRTYSEGTVTVTNGETAIQGTSTGWTDAVVGKFLVVDGDESHRYVIYDVDTVNQIIRIRPLYRGSSGSGKTYKIMSNRFRVYFCEKTAMGKLVVENWPTDNFVEIKHDGVGEVTGIAEMDDQVAVFTEDMVFYIKLGSDGEFHVTRSSAHTGTCSHRSIIEDGRGGLYYISKDNPGIWKIESGSYEGMAGKSEMVGLPILPVIQGLDQDKLQYTHTVRSKDKLIFWMAKSDVGDTCYCLDLRTPGWFDWEGLQASSSCLIDEVPLIGDKYGYISKGDTGTNDGANLLSAGQRSGTATTGGATYLRDTSQAWPKSSCKGLYLNIVSGAGAGQRRMIVSNSTQKLNIDSAWDTNPDSTSVYAIGAIRFKRRFGWFTLASSIQTWKVVIHQEAQSSGSFILTAYKNYDLDNSVTTKSISLTEAVVEVKLSMKGPTLLFDIEQRDVDTEFKIYALIFPIKQIGDLIPIGEAKDG